MIKEHARIVLTSDLPEEDLKVGDVGTVVYGHREGDAFEIEFVALDGDTVAAATVRASPVRAVTPRDIAHARHREIAV
jgi:hypothetical protein